MAAEIVFHRIDELKPYKNNPRTHSADQIDIIAASIAQFGWTNPVLIDQDKGIIAGHGRVVAAAKLGMGEVPCIEIGHLSEAERRAYVIADNQTALRAGWDEDLLRLELGELKAVDFDLGVLGFEPEALDALLAPAGTAGHGDPDEDAPDLPAEAVSGHGDIWLLGRHRLICGDATVADDVARLLDGAKPHLMVTDPPYGVNYDPDWRNRADRADGKPYGAIAVGLVSNDDRADWREAYELFPGDVAYVWHPPGAKQVEFFNSLVAAGFEVRMQIIWSKSQLVIGRGHYHMQHEPCWYAVRKGATGHWQGDRKQSTLWAIDKPRKSETGHSTQKPVECMRRPIENNSKPGQAVYEPFSGSGTTIIAAEMTGRTCYAIEIDPAYVDVAIARWQTFTGQQATLDGKTFAQVKDERHDPHPEPEYG